ncbi:MAG: DNA translocase FtsK 4TM domain-containing protein [Bacteroidia bacterium]
MAGKGNRMKDPVVQAEVEEEKEKVAEEKPVKKIKQRKEKPAPSGPSKIVSLAKDERTHKISGLFLLLMSVFMLIAFASYFFTWKNDQSLVTGSWFDLFRYSDKKVDNWLGKFGAILSHQFMYVWFGLSAFVLAFLSFLSGFKILFCADLLPMKKTLRYAVFTLFFLPPALSFIFSQKPDLQFLGGGLGYQINMWLTLSIGRAGAGFLLGFIGLSFLVAIFNFNFRLPQVNKAPRSTPSAIEEEETFSPVAGNKMRMDDTEEEEEEEESEDEKAALAGIELLLQDEPVAASVPLFTETKAPEPEIDLIAPEIPAEPIEMEMTADTPGGVDFEVAPLSETEVTADGDLQVANPEDADLVEQLGEYDPKLDLSNYQYPTLDLLENYQSNRSQLSRDELMAELEANKKRIIETLGHYDIEIDKIKATVGPTVTLFEIVPKAGIRISKIKNLEDDIALSLAALGIRIIAPIPGKGTIGIEVPNQNPDIVSMRAVIGSEKFQNSEYELPIALGKTISNEIFITDLAKMPHLLMAGATGQGKSVGLNAILVSLLYKKHPAQVKFVLVDPKKVELTLFKTIERHFLAKLPNEEEAIITDTKKVVNTLNSLCIEMDTRYDLLKNAQVRNIREYNAKFVARKLNPNNGHRFLPYIVLVVDEFADLIMTAGKEVETPIARLAQLARAIGIHLIIATQRPSVNIITGTIKANFPARLAFRVTSKIDSRTILDTGGADQLIGRGDMLLSTGSDLVRIQCAFVDTPEVESITEFIGNQRAYPDAYLLPEYVGEGEAGGGNSDMGADDLDPLFEEAAHMVVQFQQGSASLLQRRLKLGYNRAGRLVDQLEAAGVIGPFEGSKAREVRCKDLASLEQLLKGLKSPTGV